MSETTTTIELATYKNVLTKWKEQNPNSKLPVTEMLDEFGIIINRLTNGGHTVSLIVEDEKKLLLAKIKYNF